jgi:threonine/homoserine/homoserine lactone efflux protein
LAVGFVYLVQQPKVLFAFNCFASVYLLYVVYLVFQIKVQGINNSQITKKTFFLQSLVITLLNPEIAVFYGSILTGIFAKNPEFANSIPHIVLYVSGFMFVESLVFFSVAFFVSSVTSIARISMEQKMTKRSETKRQHLFAGTP